MMAKVVASIKENDNVKTLILEPEEQKDFLPGQFMMVYTIIGEGEEKRRTGRAYSIASSPTEDLMITFKMYSDGKLSPYLWNLEEGDEIEIEYPYGHFKLDSLNNVVLIAGGTGIAPIRSMAMYCKEANIPFRMMASFRSDEDIIFRNDLSNLGCDIIFTSERDRISRKDLSKFDEDSIFYICGSPQMATDIEEELMELGIQEENIRTEKW